MSESNRRERGAGSVVDFGNAQQGLAIGTNIGHDDRFRPGCNDVIQQLRYQTRQSDLLIASPSGFLICEAGIVKARYPWEPERIAEWFRLTLAKRRRRMSAPAAIERVFASEPPLGLALLQRRVPGGKLTSERPTDDACEWRVLAAYSQMCGLSTMIRCVRGNSILVRQSEGVEFTQSSVCVGG